MSAFFEEVKRRKVYRVAVAYAVVAWLSIQVSATIFPAWDMPAWTLRLVITLVLIGFPISLILAWAFDVTPEGIQRTEKSPTHVPGRGRRNVFLLSAVGLALSAVAGFFVLPRASADKVDKSIAVLPFENLSDDKENAYFADGIQDDLLTNLSKIGDLKVISRTSVMPYRGQKLNVREIGKALGVGAVLEGSVRKDRNNRVRVNVQLINTTNDQHIWSEIYDRDLTDMFAIQTDLAQKIADELQAKLSPSEKMQMARKPTENGEAYLAFVQGHTLSLQKEDPEKLKQAGQLFERALQLDPNFALASSGLSLCESWAYHSFDPAPARRERARAYAERALRLQPDSPEAHLALGFSFYYGERDYAKALKEFAIAQKGLPNDSGVHLAIGAIQRRQGRWAESNANFEKAAELSPNESWTLQNLAFNYEMQRNYAAANATLDRALKVNPDSFGLWAVKAQVELQDKGTFEIMDEGRRFLSVTPMPEETRAYLAIGLIQTRLLQRKYAEAVQEATALKDETLARSPDKLQAKYTVIGIGKRLLGDTVGANEAFRTARQFAEKCVAEAPNDSTRHSALAGILAWQGEKDASITEAKRAMELLPESVDAFDGPMATQALAEIYSLLGEQDKALELIDGLLSRPSGLSVALLKVNPIWDPLRSHPRFDDLMKKYGGSA